MRYPEAMIVLNATLFHVDVFATAPLTGNGLTVFLDTDGWSHSVMQRLTREMKQFESIFLSDISPAGATARIFTVEEELPFAGHPVLGAAAVLHRTRAKKAECRSWTLRLPYGAVAVTTKQLGDQYLCEMDQGTAVCGGDVAAETLKPILARLGLDEADLVSGISAKVVSTGLPYLVVPVRPAALARAAIQGSNLESLLGTMGAKFVLVLDVERPEIRTWDNLGKVEDVATGSAAGPAAAYLFTLGIADRNLPVDLAQGRFAGRPSKLAVVQSKKGHLLVSGEVWPISYGVLDLNPSGARISDSRSITVEPPRKTGRPTPGEYADYARADIAAVPGDDAIDALTQLAEQTPEFFRALAEAAERGVTYAQGKWTIKEILAHLVDDERIFTYRLLCLARGEDRELPGFDQDRYAAHGEFKDRALEDLLAEYSATRVATLTLLRGLPPAAWRRHGRVNGYDCSVRGLAFHIAGHELHHHRIVRERYMPLLG